jgi:hypothetical protein
MRWCVVLALLGCGRRGFDPHGDATSIASGDGAPGDGVAGDGGSTDAGLDAFPAACANAMVIGLGTTTVSTCDGSNDRLDGCAAAGTNEIVFRFTPPASGGYQFAAYNPGTQNVSNSTGRVSADCTRVTGCAGIVGTSLTAGVDYYFTVEATSGGCATIDFNIQ